MPARAYAAPYLPPSLLAACVCQRMTEQKTDAERSLMARQTYTHLVFPSLPLRAHRSLHLSSPWRASDRLARVSCTTAQRSSREFIRKRLRKLVGRERDTYLGLSFISVSSLLLFLPPRVSAPRAPFISPHLSVSLRHPPAATSPPPSSLFLRHFTPSVSSCHPACLTSFLTCSIPPHPPFSSHHVSRKSQP